MDTYLEATGSMLTRTSAYCSQESVEAIYPDKVVSKVVRRLRKPVHTTILGACSNDITNQDTAQGLEDHHSVTTVENAEYLLKSGLAQQVVVLEHNPRHDNQHKAELATLANTTLHRAREQSEHSEHILVGVHSGLEVEEGEVRDARYTNNGSNLHSKNVRLGKYDGLHMYSQAGALAFTSSLSNILGQAGLVGGRRQQAPQPTTTQGAWQPARSGRGFRRNQQQQHQNQFNMPTMNRFQGFC